MNNQALPCPFCGGKPKVERWPERLKEKWYYLVACRRSKCWAHCELNRLYETREEAIGQWNRRYEK